MIEPVKYHYTFRVRYDECDTYGNFQTANYLRHMQEAAIQASIALGYDQARYEAMGCSWVTRETRLECIQNLECGDNLIITTYIATMHRIRCVRYYEIYKANSRSIVARATTDWVFINKASKRPTSVSADMIATYGAVASPPKLEEIPIIPLDPGAPAIQRQVYWHDIDPAQHVNNAVYLAYAEDAGLQLAAVPEHTRRSHRHRIIYRQPAMLPDNLDIRVSTAPLEGELVCYYDISRNGMLIAQVASAYRLSDEKVSTSSG